MDENHIAIIHFIWAGEFGVLIWVSLFHGLARSGLSQKNSKLYNL